MWLYLLLMLLLLEILLVQAGGVQECPLATLSEPVKMPRRG